jgi:hypothetical protein
MNPLEIGRLLRASISGCSVGCRLSDIDRPAFGAMVKVPLDENLSIYGLIHDIHIDDDGLVRQLVTAEDLESGVIADNRINRNVPAEIDVLFIGQQFGERYLHNLPPRPPLSLDAIYPCPDAELCGFTSAGRFGYFRHILRAIELPIAELLGAHIQQAQQAHLRRKDPGWAEKAIRELIVLLRDEYAVLNTVLSALADLDLYPGKEGKDVR